jgi:hypothetical protein
MHRSATNSRSEVPRKSAVSAENSKDLPYRAPTPVGWSLLMCGLFGILAACEDDKPYTPFQVATALPPGEDPQNSEKVPDPPPAPLRAPAKALHAPAGATSWKAFGRTLKAPPNTVLAGGISSLNSESDDVLVWVLPEEGKAGGEVGLWSFDSEGTPSRRIFPLPDYLPKSRDCRLDASLKATGDQSVTSEVWAACSGQMLARSPIFSLAVLNPQRDPPTILHLRRTEEAAGETLTFQVDSSDRDGDGQEDVALDVTLTSPSGHKETLPFRWLSRTAGASREPDFPRKQIADRAGRLLISSIRKAERIAAIQEVDVLRRMLSSVCSELGKPRLVRATGDPLECGNLNEPLARLIQAEVQAHLGEGDSVRALGAFERASWYGKGVQANNETVRLIREKIAAKPARRLARFAVKGKTSQKPYRTPLVFDEKGQLWVLTDEKTKRLTLEGDPPLVIPGTDDEPEQRILPPEWSIDLPGPHGQSLAAVIPSCDRSEALAAFDAGSNGNGLPAPLPLPILAPRPGACTAFAPEPLPVTPLFWKSGALALATAGEVLTTQGKARFDGESVAWQTSLGVAVHYQGKLVLWTGPAAKDLHHCTVNADASKVACLSNDSSISVLVPDESEVQNP